MQAVSDSRVHELNWIAASTSDPPANPNFTAEAALRLFCPLARFVKLSNTLVPSSCIPTTGFSGVCQHSRGFQLLQVVLGYPLPTCLVIERFTHSSGLFETGLGVWGCFHFVPLFLKGEAL